MKKIIILLFTIFLVISCKSSYEYGSYYFTILSDGTMQFDVVNKIFKMYFTYQNLFLTSIIMDIQTIKRYRSEYT